MNEGMILHCGCETAVQALWTILARHGLQVVRSFDLRSALTAHAACPCPHHGTAHCDCQFIVLLVYGAEDTPVVITLHGRDEQTEMKMVPDAAILPDPHLAEQVKAALIEAALTLSIPSIQVEPAYVG